ncbi:hypothetical protein HUT13_20970 [Streptomyces harbinensis]|uniref:hypothetical protein n=1 Tax=Streptomyces harbinensis TaxID=1176198 RepID=UPI0015914381|nr:hypothetical protein [Streptomyces harbinensis]QKV70958.1 hypothetical protein HUT13_20970 [Streptomyces harbinensis]
MSSEEIPTADDAGSARHAAPRKSLLRRLHMPISLAAMPSAALLGMGLTSSLAKADPQGENPFSGTACVELPDQQIAEIEDPPAEEAPAEQETTAATEEDAERAAAEREAAEREAAEREAAEREAAEREAAEREAARRAELTAPDPDPGADAAGPADPDPDPDPETAPGPGDAAAPPPDAPEDPAAPDRTDPAHPDYNPWDPLGLGPALEQFGRDVVDFFTPGGKQQPPPEESTQEPAAEPPPEAEESDPAERTEPPQNRARDPREESGTAGELPVLDEPQEPDEPGNDPGNEPGDTTGADTAGPADEEPRDTAGAGDGADEPPEPERDVVHDPAAEDEKPGLPCPVELRVPGTDERTPVVIADKPWHLEATSLTLRGLEYHGVVNVTTASGTVKQALKFTAREVDIGDLHQIVEGADGLHHHVATESGSVSTFRDGTVTMYTERMTGRLFGVIPVEYDAEHQPTFDLPYAHFTGVRLTQAAQFGGTLTMTGMRQYMTGR